MMDLSDAQIGFVGLFLLFVLLILRMPVAITMLIIGFVYSPLVLMLGAAAAMGLG